MSAEQKGTSTRASLWLKLALGVSLAINLLIAGFIAGSLARHGGAGPVGARVPALGAFGAPYMMALQRDDRRAVLRALRQDGGNDVPSRKERRVMFDEVLEQLRADPFVAGDLEASVRRQAAASIAVQQRLQAAWFRTVVDMTDEERGDYAARVERVLNRKGRR